MSADPEVHLGATSADVGAEFPALRLYWTRWTRWA